MKSKALIEIDCGEEIAEKVKDSLSHEGNIGTRSKTVFKTKNEKLLIEINAEDVVALRATVNAVMRGIQAIENVHGRLEEV